MLTLLRRDKAFYKKLIFIALPIAGQSLISFSLTVADTFFLGFIGEQEIAAATFANSPFFVLTMIIFGAQSGASILISQYNGKGERGRISEILGISTMFLFALATIFSAVNFFFPYEIMSFFTPSHHLRTLACEYMVIVAFAFPISIFSQMLFATHRSMGNATAGLVLSIVTASVNILLNGIFIFGLFGFPRLEVAGAALGTLLARILELVIALIYSRKSTFFKVDFHAFFHPPKFISRDFFRYAGPVIMNETLWGAASALYPAVYGRLPEEIAAAYVASYSMGINVERIFNVLSRGIGDATCVIVGGELGRNNFDKAKRDAKTIILLTTLVGVVMGVILYFSSPFIANIFNISPETKAVLIVFLTILSIRTPLAAAFYTMLIGLMRAGGDSKTGMMIDITSIWIFGVFSAFIITIFTVNPWFVFSSALLDEIFKTSVASFRIISGKWMSNITVDVKTSYTKEKI